mgnify:CR=1 FL=1
MTTNETCDKIITDAISDKGGVIMSKIIRVTEETHKIVKIKAAEQGKTVSEMADQILKGAK